MTSRERNHGEGSQKHPWIVVNRRKPRNQQPLASRTCYVNHLPNTITISDISRIFRVHGAIANIHIPPIQKNPNHKYAFVQFYYPQSLITAIRDENGKKIETHFISVFPAKKDNPIPKPNFINHQQPPRTTQFNQNKTQKVQFSMCDNRSYSQVTSPKNIQETQNPPTHQQVNPTTTMTKPNPSKHRRMSSRVLGEMTEKIRDSLGEIDVDSDYAAAIEGKKCEGIVEMLQRSAIAIASSSQSSESILNHILSEGVNCLKIKSMGGMQHLLIFDTFEDKKCMMESEWLLQWFMKITNVNDQSASLWRETWISIYGVPLIAWCYENFFNVGSLLGRVISVNYNEYNCANVCIFTDCLFDINCKLSMKIGEKEYEIFVSEKMQSWTQKPGSVQEIKKQKTDDMSNSHVSSEDEFLANGDNSAAEKTKSHMVTDISTNDESPELPLQAHFPSPTCNDLGQGEMTLQLTTKSRQNKPTKSSDIKFSAPQSSQPHVPKKFSPDPKRCAGKSNPAQNQSQSSPINNIKTTNIQIIISPTKNLTSSPIPTNNKFGPLMRPSRPNGSSTSTLGSSSCSGPLFPPGFEDRIPNHTKMVQVQKRKRKLEKKRKLRLMSKSNQASSAPSVANNGPKIIQPEDIIAMANILGLTYNGPISELKEKIEMILENQKQNWETNFA